jgi:hypothetical protein
MTDGDGFAFHKQAEDNIRDAVNGAQEVHQEPPRPLTRELPPGEPFPVDALGSVLGAAADAITDRVQAPPAIAAQSVLAAATLAVQAHADVRLPFGELHARPLSCFFATIAVTGERKTTTDAEALWPARKREATLRDEHAAAMGDYLNAKDAHEAARTHARTRLKGDVAAIKAALASLGPAPQPPLAPLLLVDEPTFEGLTKLLAVGQPSLGLFTSEGGAFIGGHAMRAETMLRTATGLSSLWDGMPIRRVRGGEGSSVLIGRRLSAHLMLQPGVAALLFGNELLAAQGLLSRFLPVAPESTIGTRLQHAEAAESTPALRRYFAVLLDILESSPRCVPGERNALDPRPLPLSAQAMREWGHFADHIEGECRAGGGAESVRGLANKLSEHAARLAGVLALVADIEAGEIDIEPLQAGIALAEHYLGEALRLEADAKVTDDLRLALELVAWLRQWPAQPDGEKLIGLPDIYQRGPRAIRDQATAWRIVRILESHGWLKRIAGGGKVNGTARRDVWRIVET